MCEAIPSCYERERESPLRRVIWNLRTYLHYHPDVKDEEVVKLVKEECRQNRIDSQYFLGIIRKDLGEVIKSATDPTSSDGERSREQNYYRFYEQVLGAFGSQN